MCLTRMRRPPTCCHVVSEAWRRCSCVCVLTGACRAVGRLLKYLVYFQDMWSQFESIDKDKDGRLNVEEFKVGCATVGLDLPAAEAEAEFKKCDADGGGVILFAEFCTWCCHRSVGTDPLAKEAAEDSLRARCAEQPSPNVKEGSPVPSPNAVPANESTPGRLDRLRHTMRGR